MDTNTPLDRLILWTERWRDRLFKPILILCRRGGVTAHQITTLRLILAGGYVAAITVRPVLAAWLISLSIALDAFDGALARFLKTGSDRGKFIDVLVDQLTFVLLCLGLIRIEEHLALVLSAAMVAIPLAYFMATVNKHERTPSDWLINPQARLIVYKIIFLGIIIGYLTDRWDSGRTELALWLLVAAAGLHFCRHYGAFVSKDRL